jgi:hypothetical protein
MPSTSKKQHNFMEAIAHSPSFAKKAGVPQSVGKDFSAADKGRKFSKGGEMATKPMSDADRKEMADYRNKPTYFGYEDYTPSGRAAIRSYADRTEVPARMIKEDKNAPLGRGRMYDPVAAKKAQAVQREVMNEGRRETRGTVPAEALKKGGEVAESKAMVKKEVEFFKKKGAPASMIKHEKAEAKGYAKGGSIDGCATRGKTRLKYGGMC